MCILIDPMSQYRVFYFMPFTNKKANKIDLSYKSKNISWTSFILSVAHFLCIFFQRTFTFDITKQPQ